MDTKNKLTSPTAIEDFNVKIDENATDIPTEIEKKHVYEVYDKIALHFSHTRYKPWPKVAEYLSSFPKHSLIADIGCGNGKYLAACPDIMSIGTDRSENLLKICLEKIEGCQVFTADSLKLPIRDNVFDGLISIAVVHHFSNDQLRIKAIRELARIIKVGGKFLIYVWALEQQEKKFNQQDNFVPWHLQTKWENNVKVETLGPNIISDEQSNSIVYQRYYHVFKKDELEGLINQIENVKIDQSYFDHANWCCIVTKTH